MPDQSSAASEHAIIQEITAPLENLPDDPVALVNADFPAALRGYDRLAVDAYVQRTSQLVAELQATRSPEAAVRRALERVGDQISGILQRAHETAEEITAQSRREAENRLEQARVEAAEVAAAAAQRVRDLDADTDRIWIERHRIVDDARDLASKLLALAEAAAERFPDDNDEAGRSPFDVAQPAPSPADEPAEPIHSDEDEGEYEEAEHNAAFEEEDDVLTDEDPEYAGGATGQGAEDDGDGDDPADDEYPEDDLEATRRFAPVNREDDESSESPEEASPGGGSGSVIPPASQAANRRTSK
jgi:cell division septum initiation protein DivIVA